MANAASTVLILGARGRLGLAAAQAFAQAGWQVLAQVRPGATGPAVPGVQWLAIAAEDTPALAAHAQGAQVLLHRRAAMARTVGVGLARAVLTVCHAAGPHTT